jgi:paraquat-inducible protein A
VTAQTPEPDVRGREGLEERLLVGCPDCDLLVRLRLPRGGETARCPRCRHALSSGSYDGFRRPLAYGAAGLVLLGIALNFPFLAVDAQGLENAMSLGQAVTSLTRFGDDAVALLVTAFVLLIPAVMMAGAIALCAALLRERPARWLKPLARVLFRLDAWCMADVFAVGVIVSLVKLSTMADVTLGTAFWAFLGFALCFLFTVTSLDRLTVWTAIDRLARPA